VLYDIFIFLVREKKSPEQDGSPAITLKIILTPIQDKDIPS